MQKRFDSLETLALIRSAKKRNTAAWEHLHSLYHERIYHICYRILKETEPAKDASQQTFVKAFINLRKFKYQSAFYTWLHRVAVNESLQFLRRDKFRNHMQSLESFEEDGTKEFAHRDGGLECVPLRMSLNYAMTTLKGVRKKVFALRAIEGLSNEETAKVLNSSVPAVKSAFFFAKKNLQEVLRPYDSESMRRMRRSLRSVAQPVDRDNAQTVLSS